MAQRNWNRHLTVEECLCLSAVSMRWYGVFRGGWSLIATRERKQASNISFKITTTRPRLGGRRYWHLFIERTGEGYANRLKIQNRPLPNNLLH